MSSLSVQDLAETVSEKKIETLSVYRYQHTKLIPQNIVYYSCSHLAGFYGFWLALTAGQFSTTIYGEKNFQLNQDNFYRSFSCFTLYL
jgi:hypothetical protein